MAEANGFTDSQSHAQDEAYAGNENKVECTALRYLCELRQGSPDSDRSHRDLNIAVAGSYWFSHLGFVLGISGVSKPLDIFELFELFKLLGGKSVRPWRRRVPPGERLASAFFLGGWRSLGRGANAFWRVWWRSLRRGASAP